MVYAFINDSYAYFYIDCINSEISIAFSLLIRSWVVISKNLISLKLMHGCKPFETKNRNNLIKVELLIFAAKSLISHLSD